MPALRGRPSRWRGIHQLGHVAQTRRPSAVQRSRDRDVCGAKQVAPSVSPMGSDPGDAFALGRGAASCRPCRAKIDARSHPGQDWGTVWSPDRRISNSNPHPAPAKQYFAGERRPRSESAPALSAALTWSGGDAAGRDPSAWRGPTSPLHRREPPSDNRRAAPISRGIARATCCIACANVASAT